MDTGGGAWSREVTCDVISEWDQEFGRSKHILPYWLILSQRHTGVSERLKACKTRADQWQMVTSLV